MKRLALLVIRYPVSATLVLIAAILVVSGVFDSLLAPSIVGLALLLAALYPLWWPTLCRSIRSE